MRMPNSYGSVYKLSGKRRNPWAARKTVGWKQVPEKQRSYPIYRFIGYYPTRAEALQALAAFNEDPYDLHLDTITFAEVYERWSDVHFQSVKDTNGYKAAFKTSELLHDMKFVDIKLDHLQKVVDESGKNAPTLKNLKTLWGLMWGYAVIHEMISPDKRDIIKYVDISKAGNPNAYNRRPFSKAEVNRVWSAKDSNIYYTAILMLIYTGCRIGELLNLKKEDVNLECRYFKVTASKTAAGIRTVPIAEKVYLFFKYWYDLNDCEYLLSTPEGEPFLYRNFYDSYWRPLIDVLGMDHRPHDTRHTCISMLTVAGVSDKLIKKIVGHKGQSVTEVVYTHFEIGELIDAINKI